ncbi:AIPR family protein [Mesorhizobium neociceri]|uniref:AIPR family protein n=1 Tax=Mesorhizobium neociceri TaxID=1307853 RepID=A0A838B3G6_9HYPH|nr:AIPR family protein [Mesorhizobium neociceri]MBA1140512.1 AIPR family protein [Mesorhizobium neociceri]
MSPKVVNATTPTILDFGVVESGIRERESVSVSRSDAFTRLALETVFGLPQPEVDEYIVDGFDDRGIDIVYIDHDNRVINIGSCKTVVSYKNSRKNFPGDEIDKIISFVEDLVLNREDMLKTCNGPLAAKVREIWDIFAEESYRISVHLFSNQATLQKDAHNRLVDALSRHEIALFEYGLFELSHGVVKATKPRFRKKIVPSDDAAFSVKEANKRAVMLKVSLKELTQFLSAENQTFDERLIWQNVRYFLGLDNEVNREIRETLLSGQASDFWFLNSGLTIVCEQIVSVANGRHPITMVNPQIVNGCQTATVIHAVSTGTMADLDNGYVHVKIIETNDSTFIERVALASNTQSRILNRDLRANDNIQRQLVECLRPHNYFYVRKRGENAPRPGMRMIDAARAGQLVLAYLCGEPTKSKTNSNDIFGDLYEEAFNPHAVTPEIIIAAHECYSVIERRRKEILAWQASVTRNSFEESWLIEGHFHLLFVIGELMRRASIPLSETTIAIGLIEKASSILRTFVERNQKVANYRLFRLARSREEILKIIDNNSKPDEANPVQIELFQHLGSA